MGILLPINFTGSLPESLTQELLVGKLLVGGLGVVCTRINRLGFRGWSNTLGNLDQVFRVAEKPNEASWSNTLGDLNEACMETSMT